MTAHLDCGMSSSLSFTGLDLGDDRPTGCFDREGLTGWYVEVTIRLGCTVTIQLPAEREAEVATLASQLMQALSIMQGVALNHHGSKQYLGRRYALEVQHSSTPPA